jgi:hypothetical protein
MKKFYDITSGTVIDLHAYGWGRYEARARCTATMVNSHLAQGGVVVDYGCGQMCIREFLRNDIVYVPVDIVSRCKGCVICDFSSGEPLPKVYCDVALLNGVMQLGDLRYSAHCDHRLIRHIMEYSDFILADRRLDCTIAGDKSARGYTLKLLAKTEFGVGPDGRVKEECLFESLVEAVDESVERGEDEASEPEECPWVLRSVPPERMQDIEVGSRWQGIAKGAWAGTIATITSCDLSWEGRGSVDVQYDKGGGESDSFWLDSFLEAFQTIP